MGHPRLFAAACKVSALAALLVFLAQGAVAATYTAATCNEVDVNACINSGAGGSCSPSIHTAVDGDLILIPAGTSCPWSGAIAIPNGIGITIIGAGTPNSLPSQQGASATCQQTVITQNSGSIFTANPVQGNSTLRISCMKLVPGTSPGTPITVGIGSGRASLSCNSSGCPNIRIDNLTIPGQWSCEGISDDNFVVMNNAFGVADHNNVGDGTQCDNGVDFINEGMGAWQGVGFWGDNSWASADTLGTNQAFYIENNIFVKTFGTDTDHFPGDGNFGGGRFVCRFNTFNGTTAASGCTDHGTDTGGRLRGARQAEAYGNTMNCGSPFTCLNVLLGSRSQVSYIFENNVATGTSPGPGNCLTERRWRSDTPWLACAGHGFGQFDTIDTTGTGIFFSGTIGSVNFNGGNYIVTDSGSPGWTTNQWSPSGAPYSLCDTTKNFCYEILSNAASTTTAGFTCGCQNSGCSSNNGCTAFPAAGDAYEIVRATVCLDQPGRGQGLLVQGGDCNTFPTSGHLCPQLVSTGNPGSVNEALDPNYIAANSGAYSAAYRSADSIAVISNRDFYTQTVGQTAQTGPTTPFNGTSGTGWGTLANRPACTSGCTLGVGYWATDQGNWNTSGVCFADGSCQGELFILTAPATWTLSYTPFSYPHPLITGGSSITFTLSPATLNCGTGPLGTPITCATITGTVSGGSVTMTSTTVSGPNAVDFAIASNACTGTVTSTCSIVVHFTPSINGSESATLTCIDTASNSPQTVALSGSGPNVPSNILPPRNLAGLSQAAGGKP